MGKSKSTARKSKQRPLRDTFWILCEGKTEKKYFDEIKQEVARGFGSQIKIKTEAVCPNRIVNRAFALIQQKKQNTNQIWCVFDKDQYDDFDEAIKQARAHPNRKIHVAYSNPCFEIWLCLHFHLISSALNNRQNIDKACQLLKNNLCIEYQKGQTELFLPLKDKLAQAIDNAKKLEAMHKKSRKKHPSQKNPSTTIHKLIEKLGIIS